MGALYKNLGDEQEHTFLKVEGPDVNGTCMLDIIVKFFLRLQDCQQVAERMSMSDQRNESIRLQLIILPLIWP
jgi:hypothetical protein